MPEQIVAQVSDLSDGQMKQVSVGERTVLLVRVDSEFYALGARCPHYGAPLKDGTLHGRRLFCPWHQSVFDAVSGDLEDPPALDALGQFEVRVDGDDVIVVIPEGTASERTMQMAKYDPGADGRHFVIVGAGASANAAAEAMRQGGYQGRITMITGEEHGPYDRPDLSKDFLGSAKRSKVPALRKGGFYEEHGIEVWTGRQVTHVDVGSRTVECADGESLTADALLLATGSVPRRLDLPGGDLQNVFTLRSAQDCLRIKEVAEEGNRAVVIGASFIGLETAYSLNGRGVEVTVVAPEQVPFARVLGPEVGQVFHAMHEEKGIGFRLGARVEAFEGNGTVEAVVLADGERLEADFVLEGVGVRPATDMIAGAELNDDGSLSVDERLRVAEGVWASGDIARFPDWRTGEPIRIEHWRLAEQHGRVAGLNMAGHVVAYNGVPFFWTLHGHFSLQYVGHAPGWDDIIIRGEPSERKFVAYYVSDGRIMAVAGAGYAPTLAAAAELMRMNSMPTPQEVRNGAELT